MHKKDKHKSDSILKSIDQSSGPAISVLQKKRDIHYENEFEKRIEKLRAKGKFFNKIYSTTGAFLVIFFTIVCAVVIYFFYYNENEVNSLDFVSVFNEKYQCRMDMRVCADGSIVNRVPPECDFSNCPSVVEDKINLLKTKNKLNLSCVSNDDCSKHISVNTCQLFCANQNIENENIIVQFKKTCDADLWDPPMDLNCSCINNNCTFTKK